jgi:hypothetical protein
MVLVSNTLTKEKRRHAGPEWIGFISAAAKARADRPEDELRLNA